MARKTKTYTDVETILGLNDKSPMSGVSPRDSDQELIVQIMQRMYGANFTRDQMNLIRSLNFESITRCRRKLQEGGLYLPSPEIAKQRRLKSYEMQQVAPSESAAGLQRRIEENYA